MKIRKSYQNQLSLLAYSLDNIQGDMLPATVVDDVEILLAQLILSVHSNQRSLTSEERHARKDN